jgi:hypothetical protein
MTTYEQQKEEGNSTQSSPTVSLALTQHFFLTKWLAFRVDYKNFWYNRDVISYRNNASRSTTSNLNSDSLLMGGFTFYY